MRRAISSFFFFFNDTATTEIYTLSLHDALPISLEPLGHPLESLRIRLKMIGQLGSGGIRILDRKSTRLNSSHSQISYAVFCLKKKTTFHTPVLPATSMPTLKTCCHPATSSGIAR